MSITLVPFDSPIECMTIDTETTGLDPFDGDEILTLAMVLDIEGQDSPRRSICASSRSIRPSGLPRSA